MLALTFFTILGFGQSPNVTTIGYLLSAVLVELFLSVIWLCSGTNANLLQQSGIHLHLLFLTSTMLLRIILLL